MECKKCGTVHDGDFCPNCGNPIKPTKVKKPIYKKWWFWVIIAVVFISVVSSTGDSEEKPVDKDQSITSTVSGNANGNMTQAATQATPVTTETEAAVQEDNKYYVGDVIDANGLNITYVSAETWESDNMFMQPEDGYTYIRLKISAENKASVDRYISSFEFECYADGKKEASSYVGDETFEGGNLSAGRRSEGYIYFTVPADADSVEVEYETSFWSDKKAILVVDIFD